MRLHIASGEPTDGNRTKQSPSLFYMSTIRNDHVAACSTALRSAAEKNEKRGYVIVPCSSKMTQDWLRRNKNGTSFHFSSHAL